VFRWPDMEDPQIPTPVEEGEVGRPGDKVAAAAMDAGAGALPAAPDAEGVAGPAAGAALAPGADPATADPGPGPTPDPSPTLPRPRKPRQSPILDLDLDPRPNPSPNPSRSPDPEAVPQPPKEAPGQDLKASPSQRQRMEEKPRKSRHASNSFQAKTSDVQDRNPTQASVSCCKRFLFCLSCFGFLFFATKGSFSFFFNSSMCCDVYFFSWIV